MKLVTVFSGLIFYFYDMNKSLCFSKLKANSNNGESNEVKVHEL